MKFDRIIKSVIFIFAASLILCGCPALEDLETGSVTFTISSDVADAIESAGAQSSYRSVNPSNLFFKISIKGDYEAEKTIAATAGSTATFDGIPVYKRIHAEASAYEQNSDGTHNVLYTGTSNTIVIRKGTNTISLALQAASSGSGGGSTPSNTISYTFNGGTNPSGAPTSYTSANLPLTLPTPTKTGARFGGWYTTSDFQASSKVNAIPSGTTGTYTVYAKWIDFAVGDILLTNGTYITSSQVTSSNVNNIVGIVYALDTNGNPRGVLGIKNSASSSTQMYDWADASSAEAIGPTTVFVDSTINTSYTGSGSVYDYNETGDTDGSDNWAYLCSQDLTGTSSANAATRYPAFNWINNYGTDVVDNLSDTDYEDGWYMPSLKEMAYIRQNKGTLNNILGAITGATTLQAGCYWSSSTCSQSNGTTYQQNYIINFDDAADPIVELHNRHGSYYVLCVHKIETNTIIYSLDGGTNATSNPATSASASASTPITLANPTRSGYLFDGWYENPNFTGTRVTQITEAGYPTLYAKWHVAGSAVGDILLTDGSYITALMLTTSNVSSIVGIVYDVDSNGTPHGVFGIKNSGSTELSWGKSNWTDAENSTLPCYNNAFTNIIAKYNNSGIYDDDDDGSDNWEYICSVDTTYTTTENAATYYPAFNWANNYATTAGLTGTYATGWYIPSLRELYTVYQNKTTISAAISAINNISPNVATPIEDGIYLTSNSSDKTTTNTTTNVTRKQNYCINFGETANNSVFNLTLRNVGRSVCCVRKIN